MDKDPYEYEDAWDSLKSDLLPEPDRGTLPDLDDDEAFFEREAERLKKIHPKKK